MESIAKYILAAGMVVPSAIACIYGIKTMIEKNYQIQVLAGALVTIVSLAGIYVAE